VLERLLPLGGALMRGNAEFYLLDYQTPREPAHWHEFTMPPWLKAQLAGRWHNYLAALPDTLQLRYPDAPPVRVVHGQPGDHWNGIFPHHNDDEISDILRDVEETTVIAAHTHITMDRQVGRWHILNPGSVGNPLDGDPRAKYMILDGDANGWQATLRCVVYDYAPLFAEFERQNLVEQIGATAYLIVEEYKVARARVYPFHRWRHAERDGATETLAMAHYFVENVDPALYLPEAYRVFERNHLTNNGDNHGIF